MNWLIYIFLFILGLSFGSFINVVVLRLASKESIVKSRSHCPKCKKTLGPLDLIPIFSYLFLKGKCRYCQEKISWQYPLVEFVTACFFLLIGWHYLAIGYNLFLVRDLFFICILLVVFLTDLKYFLIYDIVNYSSAIFAFVVNLFLLPGDKVAIAWNLLLGGLIGGGFFYLQYVISKGKWIGGGDVKFGLVMGFMLGSPKIVLALFVAYVVGAIISVFLMIFREKKMNSEVPFGIFLSLATFVALLWGNQILAWYLNFIV